MLSELTLAAIAILRDISVGSTDCAQEFRLSEEVCNDLLCRLEKGGLIRQKDPTPSASLSNYVLTRPNSKISLLDILVATDQHLNCNNPMNEQLYQRYHIAARRLGIIHQMTRFYLSKIPLTDLF